MIADEALIYKGKEGDETRRVYDTKKLAELRRRHNEGINGFSEIDREMVENWGLRSPKTEIESDLERIAKCETEIQELKDSGEKSGWSVRCREGFIKMSKKALEKWRKIEKINPHYLQVEDTNLEIYSDNRERLVQDTLDFFFDEVVPLELSGAWLSDNPGERFYLEDLSKDHLQLLGKAYDAKEIQDMLERSLQVRELIKENPEKFKAELGANLANSNSKGKRIRGFYFSKHKGLESYAWVSSLCNGKMIESYKKFLQNPFEEAPSMINLEFAPSFVRDVIHPDLDTLLETMNYFKDKGHVVKYDPQQNGLLTFV